MDEPRGEYQPVRWAGRTIPAGRVVPMSEPRGENEPLLGMATTRELLTEVAVRMEVTQNSIKGSDLGRLCREALANLAPGILDYRTVGPTSMLRERVRERMERDGIPIGTDDPTLLALGARPLAPEHRCRYPRPNDLGFPANQCLDCGEWIIAAPDTTPPPEANDG